MNRKRFIRYLLIGAGFFVLVFVLNIRADFIEKSYQFNGVIQKIDYNEKKTPEVTVNDKRYALSTSWRFNEKMSTGDSLIKMKDSKSYKLIKQKTGEIFFSNQ